MIASRVQCAIYRAAGIPEGTTELWCNIESALGAANAREIAAASPRIAALALGAEDYTTSMGSARSKAGWEIFYARMQVLEACRLAGVSAQDAVFSDLDDLVGLQEDSKQPVAWALTEKPWFIPGRWMW